MEDCIFCKIAKKEIPAAITWEDADTVAFKDIHPRSPVHILIVPRVHLASVNEIAPRHEPALGKLLSAAKRVAELAGVAQSGYRLIINTGPDAGQVVDHLHLHLLGGAKLGPKGEEL